MPKFWGSPLIAVALLLGAAWLVAVTFSRLIRLGKELLGKPSVERVTKAIQRYLNEDDGGMVVWWGKGDAKARSDEALNRVHPCVVCLECGYGDDEDLRGDSVLVCGQYIPLCEVHKKFVAECLKKGLLSDDDVRAPSV